MAQITLPHFLTSSSLLYNDLELSSDDSDSEQEITITALSSLFSDSSDSESSSCSYPLKKKRKRKLPPLTKRQKSQDGPSAYTTHQYTSENFMSTSSDFSSTSSSSSSDEEDDEYDPDNDVKPGCSSWSLLMSKRGNKSPTPPPPSSSSSSSSTALSLVKSKDCVVPERVLSVFSTLLEKDRFQFSQSVSFLRVIRKQVTEAMNSAFSAMLSTSGIRIRHQPPSLSHQISKNEDQNSSARMAKILSDIAASSNPENSFRPAASIFNCLKNNKSKRGVARSENRTLSQVCSKVIFYREIHIVISLYLSLVYIQRAMNNNNTNSSGYSEGMVIKMLNIIGKIPHNEMSREKYVSVGRDALYLYQNIITDVTGPKHSKRLRTPQQQADFCYVIAMLVNNVPIVSDLTLAGKATNLVQFASAMSHPAYRLAVHKIGCVFNSSYSVYKVLDLDRYLLTLTDLILTILSVRNKPLTERKPRTLTQSVYLFLQPSLRDKLRASGLTSEESSLGTAVKLVSQQLRFEGVHSESLEDGCRIMSGNYGSSGITLKCLGQDQKDIKTVGLATLFCDRLRKRMKKNIPFY